MASNVAGRLNSLAKRLDKVDVAVSRAAGAAVRDEMLKRAGSDAGGDRRLSGLDARPPLDVVVRDVSGGVQVVPSSGTAGAWAIVSSGTKAHTVAAKRGGRSSQSRAMRVGSGGWAVGPWRVGPTRGKDTWEAGAAAGRTPAMRAAEAVFQKAVSG